MWRCTRFTCFGTEPTEVYLIGYLNGFLHATDGGYARVNTSLALFDADGNRLADAVQFFDVTAPFGGVDEEYFNIRPVWISATVIPGEGYEFVSSLEVYARKGAYLSTARAMFDNTFTVELSGVVPEPATVTLPGLGDVGLLGK